ncbi:MAG: leucyl aminopeptidase [Asgard group archaeon]|nr:leucyl aminopeptidase [Asgard group archaeon]
MIKEWSYVLMFDIKKFYEKENSEALKDFEVSLERLKAINEELLNIESNDKKNYFDLLRDRVDFILKLAQFESILNEDYFKNNNFAKLKKDNENFFTEILPDNYKISYSNPAYSVKVFGEKFGQLMAFFHNYSRLYVDYAYKRKIFKMLEFNKLVIELFDYLKNNTITYDELHKIITQISSADRTKDYTHVLIEANDPNFQFYTHVLDNEDLTDLRYLFRMGKHITNNEIKIAKFLSSYSIDKLKTLAKSIVKAYFKGFKRDNKKIGNKTVAEVIYPIGMERLIREVKAVLKKNNLSISCNITKSTTVNEQAIFDHKFDIALIMNDELATSINNAYCKALENTKELLSKQAGVINFITFGEKPFNPERKSENPELSNEQTEIYQRLTREINQNHVKYQPVSETSFCIVAFPNPIINRFEELFDKIIEINMLDSDKYEKIQQKMIDKLDTAEFVHIKGKDGNCTDLIVKLQELKDLKNETNFVNSGASVNIPAGELFTTPQLKGTNGILHVAESYQNKLLFKDLKITFKDGFTADYSCSNFKTEEENRNFIEQNLLFPHKILPMGEFAIGTNTLAYVVSREYDILDVLPILISEKTGPHFAIGDTCFQMREDVKTYNQFTKKQVVACDNEKTILRKTDRKDEAYTFKHNDIVMPFSAIDFITAVKSNGEKIDLIRNGRFVLEGTEELNIPLNEYEK